MKKAGALIRLVSMAILLASIYGIVHDQISYTVSPEYFTKFKFWQFELIDSPLPERIRVGIIGFSATWWMGLLIGLLVGVVGLIHRGADRMWTVTLRSFYLAIGLTLAVGLIGLAYGFYQTRTIDLAAYDRWYIPVNVIDLRRFLCVGYMHNASYLGGALSIIAAWIYHVIVKLRTPSPHSPP